MVDRGGERVSKYASESNTGGGGEGGRERERDAYKFPSINT
jgi:hypothetical protein